jgi:hypothetical protein
MVQRVLDRLRQIRLRRLLGQPLHQPGFECVKDRPGLGLADNHALGGRQTTDPLLDLIHRPDPL